MRIGRNMVAVAAVLTALGLAGCGLPKFPAGAGTGTGTATEARAGTTATKATAASASRPASGATAATDVANKSKHAAITSSVDAANVVREFANTYINWNAQNFASLLARLAGASVGQARETMALDAAEVSRDSSLEADGLANRGTVESVARLPGAASAGGAQEFVVVTREQTSATKTNAYTGVAAAWHVTLATVVMVSGTWRVSEWQPQS